MSHTYWTILMMIRISAGNIYPIRDLPMNRMMRTKIIKTTSRELRGNNKLMPIRDWTMM